MSDKLPSKIITVVEAIHNGITKNYTMYPAEKLEMSAESWQHPYNKPVIKNHNTYEEPLGRVVKQEFKKSIIDPEKFTIQLHLEISDPDTIQKVMDGRYHTLSIGGATDSCVCSICGKDILKEGYCGHWKGRTYEGKTAHWTVGQMEFEEISFVNVPADGNARVIIPNLEAKGNKNKESAEGRTPNVKGFEDADKILEGAEGAEGKQDPAGDPPATEPVKEGKEGEGEAPVARTIEQVEQELADAKAALQTAEGKVTTLTEENTTLKESNTTLDARVKELEGENEQQFKQNVELAKTVRQVLAEAVADVRIALGKDKAEDRELNVAEYAKSNAKSLGKQLEEMRAEKPARQPGKAENPGLANNDDPHAQTEGDKSSEKGEMTLDKLAEAMEKAIFGRN